eukprot:665844_1
MTYENGSDEENSSHVQMIQSMVCTTDAISLEICMRTYIIEFIPHTLDYKQHELQSTTAKFDGLSEQHNEVGLCDILRIDSDTLKQMVAAQHGQKTEYESKALEFTRSLEEKEQMIQTLTQ